MYQVLKVPFTKKVLSTISFIKPYSFFEMECLIHILYYQSRCQVVYNITTSFSFTKKGRIPNFYIYSILPMLPIFLRFYPIGNSWHLAFSNFTETDNFKIYVLCLFSLGNILITVLLIIFSLIAISKFNERMRKSQEAAMVAKTSSTGSRFRKDEIQSSRIISFSMTLSQPV